MHIVELKQAENYLNKVKEKIQNSTDNKVLLRTDLIGSLSAVDGIIAFAKKYNVDLIIVGTRGRSGFTCFFLLEFLRTYSAIGFLPEF